MLTKKDLVHLEFPTPIPLEIKVQKDNKRDKK